MDIPARKQRLRRELIGRVLALEPEERRVQESVLADRFATLPGFSGARTVLLYVSAFPEEIATVAMLRQSLELGKRLACPRVDRRVGRLRLHEVRDLDSDLRPGTLGIPEPRRVCPEIGPESIDWVLVPGLGFDERGYRLGRGAGHYDRLLPTLRPDAPRWALGLDCQWVEELPVEPHDVRLDGVATPSRFIAFPRSERV
jgi:5-formyltetrahydrofolate cyclo-ligase